MTGKKGKSGKVTTPEQRQAKIRAARLGGQAKNSGVRRPAASPPPEPARPPQDPTLDGAFPVETWIDLKDRLACDLAQRKIEQADIDVATSRVAYDRARGDLLTRAQAEEREEAIVDLFVGHLEEVGALVAALVSPERIIEARARASEWALSIRTRVADALEARPK